MKLARTKDGTRALLCMQQPSPPWHSMREGREGRREGLALDKRGEMENWQVWNTRLLHAAR